jgi:phage shock protein PspC (stress-responsive transcriptional regulator)
MNKTVTANISGVVFHIESEAYDHLHQYLNTIRKYFHDSDGKEEIMTDIEARIAELFSEKLSEGKEVIVMQDVRSVIEIMGEPEAYMSDEPFEEESSKKKAKSSEFSSKKLYRDEDDNLIGGVCSGLGYYFGVNKVWFRAIFLAALLAGVGAGFLIYIVLWILIPTAKTTAEKLEMKGEPVNVDSIGNAIKDEFSNFKKKVDASNANDFSNKAKNGILRLFEFIGKILYYAVILVLKIFAFFLVLGALIALVVFTIVSIGAPFDVELNNNQINENWLSEHASLFFSSDLMYGIGLAGVCLIVVIPLIGILYGGLKMLFRFKGPQFKAIGFTAVSLWALGIILVLVSGSSTAKQFTSEQTYIETVKLPNVVSDTLRLNSLLTEKGIINEDNDFFIKSDSLYLNNLDLNIVKSKSSDFELYLKKESKGPNRKKAGELAKSIAVEFRQIGNKLEFSELIRVPLSDKFRKQEVKVSLGVPEGKTVFLDRDADRVIYDIKNVSNTFDYEMIGHHWQMTKEGLSCTDCEWLKSEEKQEADSLTVNL